MKQVLMGLGVAVVMVAAVAVVSFAREGQHGVGRHHGFKDGFGHRFERMIERMADRLDLSDQQRTEVFAVLDETRPARRDLRAALADHRQAFQELDPTADNYQTQLQGMADEIGQLASQTVMLMGQTRSKISALLTDEQRAQAKQMLQEHWGSRHHDAR